MISKKNLPDNWLIKRFRNILISTNYGTSEKSNAEGKGIPVLRIPNIIGGKLDFTDLKYVELEEKDAKKLSLKTWG